jgi:hypothetical protein
MLIIQALVYHIKYVNAYKDAMSATRFNRRGVLLRAPIAKPVELGIEARKRKENAFFGLAHASAPRAIPSKRSA